MASQALGLSLIRLSLRLELQQELLTSGPANLTNHKLQIAKMYNSQNTL